MKFKDQEFLAEDRYGLHYTHGEESASARESPNLYIYVIGGDSSYLNVTHTEYQRQENTGIGLEFIHGIIPLLTVLTK